MNPRLSVRRAKLVLASIVFSFCSPISSTAKSIISEFMCPCEDHCGKALEVCECSNAAGYIKEITDLQAAGFPDRAIREKFVEKFGLTVLASPPAEGFGLLAYLAPPFAVVAGIVAASMIALKWSRRKKKEVRAKLVSESELKRAEELLDKWKS